MEKKTNNNFIQFLDKFPEVELPINLTEDSHFVFSRKNDPLPEIMVEQHISPTEQEEADEFTEYVPCFKIPKTHDFHAIIYWKAGLMNYEYTLVTFSKKGAFINKKVIAGTKAEGEALIRSMAIIEENWKIHVVGGIAASEDIPYTASSSRSFHLELLATGQIIILN